MSGFIDLAQEEYIRLKELIKFYLNDLERLPKGKLSIKPRKGRDYVYLVYREKEKVKFNYIGPAGSERVKKLEKQIEERKELQLLFKKAKDSLKEVERVLRNRK